MENESEDNNKPEQSSENRRSSREKSTPNYVDESSPSTSSEKVSYDGNSCYEEYDCLSGNHEVHINNDIDSEDISVGEDVIRDNENEVEIILPSNSNKRKAHEDDFSTTKVHDGESGNNSPPNAKRPVLQEDIVQIGEVSPQENPIQNKEVSSSDTSLEEQKDESIDVPTQLKIWNVETKTKQQEIELELKHKFEIEDLKLKHKFEIEDLKVRFKLEELKSKLKLEAERKKLNLDKKLQISTIKLRAKNKGKNIE